MNRNLLTALLLGIVAAVSVTSCCGSDLIAPDWRGSDGSTYQQWEFDSDANPALPEVIINSYGGATADVYVGEYGSGWLHQLPGMGNETGYWDLGSSGTITIDVANSPLTNAYREIWLQVTYFKDIHQAPSVDIAGAVRLGGETRLVEQVASGGEWLLDQSMWRVDSGAGAYPIVLTSDAFWAGVVSEVVVDTRSVAVPEPASLSILLLGSGAVMLRRRFSR